MTTDQIFAFLTGYLLGSIPFGLLLTRLAGKGDIRDVGSGNIGATNVLRAGGKALAVATLVLDALKATAAVLIARQLWPGSEILAAAGALIGHLYPLWLKFRGGKGVATYLGLLIPLFPIGAAIFAAAWLAALLLVRISSVAGILAVISAPIAAAAFDRDRLFPSLLLFTLLVLWRHHDNIARLRAGKEPKIASRRG
ncbi:MAG TPA: glycerol-3-phosphate 1-O-acyltransferase PlsY [Sphingomicrobium sp.]|nr:glycerol-3-phosphate 1-O-acyltransferase PlsY [Sphingomicrobium sp.]